MSLFNYYSLRSRAGLMLMAAGALWSAAPANAATSYSATVLADHPLAYYRLEEPQESLIATDSSPDGLFPGMYNYNGTYPQLGQPGIDTNSIAMQNAVASSVTMGYYPEFNPAGPFSFEIWARPTSAPTGGDYRCPIGNFGGWGTGGGSGSGWYVYQTPGAGSTLAFIMAPTGVWLSSSYSLFKWYHLVGTYDGTTAAFYVNGVAIGTASANGYLPNPLNPLALGHRGDGYGAWDGNLDEAAIYTNALTPAQVLAHYEAGTNAFRNPPVPAAVRQDPTSTTNFVGHTVQFTVLADGTPPLAYQWYRAATGPVAAATTTALSFTCAEADDGAGLYVIVTNNYGSATSAVATLTVSRDLLLKSQPASITRTEGPNSTAAFLAVADGALPLTYQWYKGATAIPGATSQTLWLTGLQQADSGSTYYARISNAYTFTNTEPATLTIQARATVVPITGYAKVVMADHPVAFWRLDEDGASGIAVDAAGSFDGTYSAGNGTFSYRNATGIPHETDTAVGLTGGATVNIPYALELNPWGPFTYEAWLQPASLAVDGNDYRTPLSSMFNVGGVGPTGWLLYQQGNNTWSWWPYGANWASAQLGAAETIAANQWYHVVLVYDGSSFTFFLNGTARASGAYPGFVQNGNVPADNPSSYHYTYDGSGPTVLGWRSDSDFHPFQGTIDDVAVYSHALSAAQVQAHFAATVRLTITPTQGGYILSWPFGTLQQADQVTGQFSDLSAATSPLTNTASGTAKFFRVKVQ